MNFVKLLNTFQEKKVELKDGRALPQGFYLITKVEVIPTEFYNYRRINVEARWHNEISDPAHLKKEGLPVNLDFSPLYLKYSIGPKELDPKFLKDCVINILKVKKDELEYNGEKKSQMIYGWKITSIPENI